MTSPEDRIAGVDETKAMTTRTDKACHAQKETRRRWLKG